ncbi:MAG TPA: protein-L-isoaspartate(D-aspartate) O-methyltransferase [bacterium]|nr:protein-L-isoaspartate(D-aspartate) O-methyltransferase [bacterium]
MLGFLFFRNCTSAENPENYSRLREQMVKRQIIARGVKDEQVIKAMRTVPRHLFVPEGNRSMAYDDTPLPIGEGQTISQPYIVAFMTDCLKLKPEDRILEIGTGSGYQAAILAELVKEVYTIEIIPVIGNRASKLLDEMGYTNVHVMVGDGFKGWPEKAPFDAIIVTCAPDEIPKTLVNQLSEGGKIIVPVGSQYAAQHLILGVKKKGRLITENILPVRFVPMVRGNR